MHIAHIDKSGNAQSCSEHCRNTAKEARDALQSANLGSCAELAGLLHDCGKFSNSFDAYLREAVGGTAKKGSVIHSFAGLYYLLKHHHSSGAELGVDDIASEILAAAIASHHGLIDAVDENGQSGFIHRLIRQPEYEKEAICGFLTECASNEELGGLYQKAVEEVSGFFATLTCGVPNPSSAEMSFYVGLLTRLITSAVVEGDRTDTADFMSCHLLPQRKVADKSLWKHLSERITMYLDSLPQDTPISEARRSFSDACAAFGSHPEGVFRLDLPTGGGKTISSFRYAISHAAAHGKDRIFYIAPLLTILEQNASVIKSLVQDDSLVLEHHSNVVNETASDEDVSRYDLLTENWAAPVVVTSMVQFLNTLFSGKMSSVRRFHAFVNSVIIIDEVQAIPREDISLFNLAINFLSTVCRATVILCSATQPCFEATSRYQMRADNTPMIPVSLLERYKDLFERTKISFEGRVSLSDIPHVINKELTELNSLLVVCNTKKEASALFDLLEGTQAKKFFLTAGLCKAHRKAVLDSLYSELKSGNKLVCISTQVIEAGVDISFQGVIRVLAGLDSVVQSAGRCNRSSEFGSPMPVSVYDVTDEKLGSLDSIKDAQYAMRDLLFSFGKRPEQYGNSLSSQQAVSYYYRQLFRKIETNQGLTEHPLPGMPSIFELLSDNAAYSSDTAHGKQYYLAQAFRTAGLRYTVFDDDTISVLVPYGDGNQIIEQIQAETNLDSSFALLQKAKDYLVTIYSETGRKMIQSGAIRSVWDGHLYILSSPYYDPQTGINDQPRKELMECSTLIL